MSKSQVDQLSKLMKMVKQFVTSDELSLAKSKNIIAKDILSDLALRFTQSSPVVGEERNTHLKTRTITFDISKRKYTGKHIYELLLKSISEQYGKPNKKTQQVVSWNLSSFVNLNLYPVKSKDESDVKLNLVEYTDIARRTRKSLRVRNKTVNNALISSM